VVVPLNVDVYLATRSMIAASRKLAQFTAALPALAYMGGLDVDAVQKLEQRAHALVFAHERMLHEAAGRPVQAIAREAVALRRRLALELKIVELRGGIEAGKVRRERRRGHLALADDIRSICVAFLANRRTVKPILGDRGVDLDLALKTADALVSALVDRQRRGRATEARRIRDAAWTLALHSYREAERWIDFIRFHDGDADDIVPPLWDSATTKPTREPKAAAA
jgi:hypothetical protein